MMSLNFTFKLHRDLKYVQFELPERKADQYKHPNGKGFQWAGWINNHWTEKQVLQIDYFGSLCEDINLYWAILSNLSVMYCDAVAHG